MPLAKQEERKRRHIREWTTDIGAKMREIGGLVDCLEEDSDSLWKKYEERLRQKDRKIQTLEMAIQGFIKTQQDLEKRCGLARRRVSQLENELKVQGVEIPKEEEDEADD